MIVRIDSKHFFPAWAAISPPQAEDGGFPEDERYYTDCVRVEAANGMLRLRGPFGNAECPAEVERPGVLFTPIREFIEATENLVNEPVIELSVVGDKIHVNYKCFITQPEEFFLFDDVADAPENRDDFEIVIEEDADLIED